MALRWEFRAKPENQRLRIIPIGPRTKSSRRRRRARLEAKLCLKELLAEERQDLESRAMSAGMWLLTQRFIAGFVGRNKIKGKME